MYAMKVDEAQAMHWTEVSDPVPKAGEVLLKIRAAALNRADLLQRAGKYPPPSGRGYRGGQGARRKIRTPAAAPVGEFLRDTPGVARQGADAQAGGGRLRHAYRNVLRKGGEI